MIKYSYTIVFLLFISSISGFSQVLIPYHASWKYLDDGSDQGTAWTATTFVDSSWAEGNAELGYGDGDENTLLSYGPDPANKYPCTYFRKSFDVTDPASILSLDLHLLVDDGAAIYLNGVELLRQNMPADTFNYLTYTPGAIAGVDEDTYTSYYGLSSENLIPGTNVLAAEVHQRSAGSSDISFNFSLEDGGDPNQLSLIRGPYLQIGTPNSQSIKWRTSLSSNSRVYYGTDSLSLTEFVEDTMSVTDHIVTLEGLLPNTTYYYSIGSDSLVLAGGSDAYSFKTSPQHGTNQPIRAWILGDCGTGNFNAAAVRDAYYNYAETNELHTDMMILLGDNAYTNGLDSEYQTGVFNMYTSILPKVALWACPGNHDYYGDINNYLNIFTLPSAGQAGGIASGTERYYSFDYGNIHFISLDSYGSDRTVGGIQYNWLETDLNNTSQDWVIAFWHHPAYSNGSHNSDSSAILIEMRENFLPLLESHGVDLVLSGHSHSYERSFLLKGHYGPSSSLADSMILDSGDGNPLGDGAYTKSLFGPQAGDGAVYITAGSSGKLQSVQPFPMMYTWQEALGSVVLEAQGEELRLRFLRTDNTFTDDFTITKDIVQEAPVAIDDTASTFEGNEVLISVFDNDFDADGDLDTMNSSTEGLLPPLHGTAVFVPGEAYLYTPVPGFTGWDQFEYSVCDMSQPEPLCATARVSVFVDCQAVPELNIIRGTVFEDTDSDGLFKYENGREGITVHLYLDKNGNGIIEPDDPKIDSLVSDTSGNYSFLVNPFITNNPGPFHLNSGDLISLLEPGPIRGGDNGFPTVKDSVQLQFGYLTPITRTAHYIVRIDPGSLPSGNLLSTDSTYSASFADVGQSACHNDFGFTELIQNDPPSILLLSPGSGEYNTVQTFNIIAGAIDEDGSIAQLEFFINGLSVGTGLEEPPGVFTSPQQELSADGSYQIYAVAEDDEGATAVSNTVLISLTGVDPEAGQRSADSGQGPYHFGHSDMLDNLRLYPNPTSNTLNIEFDSALEKEGILQIVSMEGRLMKEQEISIVSGHNSLLTDLSGYNSGVYLVLVKSYGQHLSRTVILE